VHYVSLSRETVEAVREERNPGKERIMSTVNTSMQGKICMVTGANSGIGKATALALAQMGATLVMVCRDLARGEEARSEITTKSRDTAVDLLQADLSSQQSIRQLVEHFQHHYPHLHVLINNAGAAFSGRRETVDGLEMTFAVNYLAPFLLTNLLLDVLTASAPARIVTVSSAAQASGSIHLDDLQAEKHFSSRRAYGQSKLAIVLFTYALARRLQGTGVTANCLDPGFVATNIGQRGASLPVRLLVKLIWSFGTSPEKGAQTSIYLASSPEVEGVTGQYFAKGIPRRSAASSYDESLQRHLWEQSAKLVHL
jgi:NAD(P)-dependent dehydrogenase (short-subunit alcohol dehydrogenase family)